MTFLDSGGPRSLPIRSGPLRAIPSPLERHLREAAAPEPSALKAHEMLVGIAERRTGPVDAARLAAHVIRLHGADGWPILRAAFEALMERIGAAARQELRVLRAARATPLGVYQTRRKGQRGALPFSTALRSVEPLAASCDCPDFLVNGLGFCAHVFAALAHVEARPRRLERALRAAPVAFALDWEPTRPLLGAEPWWARLRLRSSGRKPSFAEGWRRRSDGTWAPGALSPRGAEAMLRAAAAYATRSPERVSPAARAMLAEVSAPLVVGGPAGDDAAASLATLRRPLYPYQREAVERVLREERLLLADDMGLGKTAQAIAVAHALFYSGRARRGLFVVPAALKSQWLREWHAFTDAPATIVGGPPAARRRRYREAREGFLIVNYELLLRDGDALREFGADLVVLDEAQRIKNPHTKTARAVARLRPRFRLALTGTPLENRLGELAAVVGWVDPRALQPLWRLPVVHGGVGLAQHLGSLRARLAHCVLRRRRADILRQLPPRLDTSIPVPLSPAQRGPHEYLSRKIAPLVKIRKRRPLTPAERLELLRLLTGQRIVANGMAQRRFDGIWDELRRREPTEATLAGLGSPKLSKLREVIQSLVIDQGRTILVFSQWRRMLRLAHWATRDLLDAQGLRAVFFTGAESPRQRDRSVVELHDDPRTRVLFSSDAGGVGLNLQRAATAVVNLELPWNPAVLEQRVARIHRIGQDRPIDVLNLVTQDSIEARIQMLVGAKQALFTGLFDSQEDSVSLDTERLLERLTEEPPSEEPPSEEPPSEPPPSEPPQADADAKGTGAAPPSEEAEPARARAPARDEPSGPAATSSRAQADDGPAADQGPPSVTTSGGGSLAELLASLTIAARADGGVQIDAPPAAAAHLASWLRVLAAQIERRPEASPTEHAA